MYSVGELGRMVDQGDEGLGGCAPLWGWGQIRRAWVPGRLRLGRLAHPTGPDRRNASEAPAALEKASTHQDEGLWRLSPKPTLAFGLPLSCTTHPNPWAEVTAGQRRPRQDGRKAPDGFII